MKKITWRKHHKWLGLLFCFFMLMFCLSGIVLNHRSTVAEMNISRKWLPASYHFKNWNGGLLRGTLCYRETNSISGILLYGNSGIWKTDSCASTFTDFNNGLPEGMDFRNIRGIVQTPTGELFAAGAFGLFRYGMHNSWQAIPLALEEGERLTDIICKGDTLIVAGRSRLYSAMPPYNNFCPLQIKAPEGYSGKVSLFRTIWMLHSGELFGIFGKLLMDTVAVILIMLCLTGVLYWLLPRYIHRLRKAGYNVTGSMHLLRSSLAWHDKIGRTTIILTLFICVTGWCLRPPLLIALAQSSIPAIPGTSIHSSNAWHDKLRMLRYDDLQGDWLLSTSEGFYALNTLNSIPVKVKKAPPVSVMGMNVWQRDARGNWLCGSFSGMYVWNRQSASSTDYFTGAPAPEKAGAPFGQKAITGYSADFPLRECIAEYYTGTPFAPMPKQLSYLPMSLWNLALEIHTGRIYTFLGQGTLIFIFFAGGLAVWCLWSGYKIRKRKFAN